MKARENLESSLASSSELASDTRKVEITHVFNVEANRYERDILDGDYAIAPEALDEVSESLRAIEREMLRFTSLKARLTRGVQSLVGALACGALSSLVGFAFEWLGMITAPYGIATASALGFIFAFSVSPIMRRASVERKTRQRSLLKEFENREMVTAIVDEHFDTLGTVKVRRAQIESLDHRHAYEFVRCFDELNRCAKAYHTSLIGYSSAQEAYRHTPWIKYELSKVLAKDERRFNEARDKVNKFFTRY